MVGGANLHLESNPFPTRDTQRDKTNLVCTRTQGPHRLRQNCLIISCGGTGWQWSAAGTGPLGVGMAQVLLEEVTINPITELPELTEDWEWTLGGHNRTLCTRTQEKGIVTPQETVPDLPVCVRDSLVKVWVCGGLLQGWGHRL